MNYVNTGTRPQISQLLVQYFFTALHCYLITLHLLQATFTWRKVIKGKGAGTLASTRGKCARRPSPQSPGYMHLCRNTDTSQDSRAGSFWQIKYLDHRHWGNWDPQRRNYTFLLLVSVSTLTKLKSPDSWKHSVQFLKHSAQVPQFRKPGFESQLYCGLKECLQE